MKRSEALQIRDALDGFIMAAADVPAHVNSYMACIRPWKEGTYAAGDVRMYEGAPYKCVQAHDSTSNPTWNPTVASLWMQYHGTSKETARPWVAPNGAHDMYKVDEYMIWTDGNVYHCTVDTVYSPTDYPTAWEIV